MTARSRSACVRDKIRAPTARSRPPTATASQRASSIAIASSGRSPDRWAETIASIRPFLPTTVSGSYERGDALDVDDVGSFTPVEKVRSVSADLMWDTRLGQTTLSYWQRSTKATADEVRLESTKD